MPCWPDLWEHVKSDLPNVEGALVVLAYIALVGLLLWAPKLLKRRARIASRVIGGIAATPLALLLPALFVAMLLASGDPPAQTRSVSSSHGSEATVVYQAGFLGRDFTKVTLKQSGCCRHKTVFSHSGPSWFGDPQLQWLDDHHLEIAFHSRAADPIVCTAQQDDVAITCTKLLWPDSTSPGDSTASSPSMQEEKH